MATTVETLLNPAKFAQLTSKLRDDKLLRIEVDAVVIQLAKVLKPLFQLMQLYVLKGDRPPSRETAKQRAPRKRQS